MIGNSLLITGCFDGGNPKAEHAIVQTADDAFNIEPFSEDGDPNYKFRLDIIISNHSDRDKRIKLIIKWNDEIYQHLRDYVYYKGPSNSEWVFLSCTVKDLKTKCLLKVQPGETFLCMQPKYNYEDYLNLIDGISTKSIAEPELIGSTAKNKKIWCVRFNKSDGKSRRKLMAVSRIHPYETAGSYCAHNVVELSMRKA